MLNSGPPELPLLIGASVWMKSSYGPCWMSRPRDETIPAVTVPDRPNGLPIASTQSPTRDLSLSPNATAGSLRSVCTCSTARSVRSSWPISLALSTVLSCSVTVISSAPLITWLLVTMTPDGSMMKPDPSACILRGGALGSPPPPPPCSRFMKSWKNFSNGDPGGKAGMPGPGPGLGPAPGPSSSSPSGWSAATVSVEEMLTTAGSSEAARSAKLSGAARAAAGAGGAISTAATVACSAPAWSMEAAIRQAKREGARMAGQILERRELWGAGMPRVAAGAHRDV